MKFVLPCASPGFQEYANGGVPPVTDAEAEPFDKEQPAGVTEEATLKGSGSVIVNCVDVEHE